MEHSRWNLPLNPLRRRGHTHYPTRNRIPNQADDSPGSYLHIPAELILPIPANQDPSSTATTSQHEAMQQTESFETATSLQPNVYNQQASRHSGNQQSGHTYENQQRNMEQPRNTDHQPDQQPNVPQQQFGNTADRRGRGGRPRNTDHQRDQDTRDRGNRRGRGGRRGNHHLPPQPVELVTMTEEERAALPLSDFVRTNPVRVYTQPNQQLQPINLQQPNQNIAPQPDNPPQTLAQQGYAPNYSGTTFPSLNFFTRSDFVQPNPGPVYTQPNYVPAYAPQPVPIQQNYYFVTQASPQQQPPLYETMQQLVNTLRHIQNQASNGTLFGWECLGQEVMRLRTILNSDPLYAEMARQAIRNTGGVRFPD